MSGEIEAAPMCFACGVDNPIGLKIRFDVEGDVCTAEFTPNENHVGFSDTVHGGIIYTILDDVTANILYQQGRKAHTAKCEIRYRQPVRVGQRLMLRGWIENERRRLIMLKGEVRRADDDVLVADCESSFMLEKAP
ncbi:MAG: PaaI family thioesterase [Woeseiaceae bacterium]|jgi:acyl-coenzyme A thioesterase PaaI-like protein